MTLSSFLDPCIEIRSPLGSCSKAIFNYLQSTEVTLPKAIELQLQWHGIHVIVQISLLGNKRQKREDDIEHLYFGKSLIAFSRLPLKPADTSLCL